MRNYFIKGILLSSILFMLLSTISNAALIKSTGSGNWNSAIWEDENGFPATPTDGDSIIIDVGHTITINNTVELDSITLAIRGNLFFTYIFLVSSGQLILDVTSIIIVEDGGSIFANFWSSLLNQIEIGDNTVWNGLISGSISEETTLDSTGSSSGTPPGYIPLPIELISFDTQLSGTVVEINWATATELNNEFFTIERSDNGADWSIIGEAEGAGDSHIRLDYQFIDYDPIPGMSYYRLKQTDFDGQFEYFDPSVIRYEPENLLRLFPNPVEDYLNITTVSDMTDAIIIIKNLNGKQEQVTVSLSNGHQAQLEMGHLSTGVYLMEIIFPESVLTSRILKK